MESIVALWLRRRSRTTQFRQSPSHEKGAYEYAWFFFVLYQHISFTNIAFLALSQKLCDVIRVRSIVLRLLMLAGIP